MDYIDIFMLGWNLNALMFAVNLLLAFKIIKSDDVQKLQEESQMLHTLKTEFDKLYPNRRLETLISYAMPFTAFYRGLYRIIEMYMFFNKNKGTSMFDFMVYKYQADINKIKNDN